MGAFQYITSVFDTRLLATIYLIGFQFAKQLAAIFLSAFAGSIYDRIGLQDTYPIPGGIMLAVTLVSVLPLSAGRCRPLAPQRKAMVNGGPQPSLPHAARTTLPGPVARVITLQ